HGAGRLGVAELMRLGLDTHQHGVVHAVIGAFGLDDAVASGEASRQADRVHGRFRAAVREAHLLHRKARADFLRQLRLELVRHAKHSPGPEALPDGANYGGMAVPGHQRAETEVEIEVLIAVEVAQARTQGVSNEDGIRVVDAEIAAHAQGLAQLGSAVGGAGAWRALLKCLNLPLQAFVHRVSTVMGSAAIQPRGGGGGPVWLWSGGRSLPWKGPPNGAHGAPLVRLRAHLVGEVKVLSKST